MSKTKLQGTINLEAEIEIRRRVSDTFDRIIDSFTGGLAPNSPEDVDTLALFLIEVREQKKLLDSQEDVLKKEIRRFFPENALFLDLNSSVVILELCSRTDLDKERIATDYGTKFIEQYSKVTKFEKLLAKRK